MRGAGANIFSAVLGVCLGLLLTIVVKGEFDALAAELTILRTANERLRQQLLERESIGISEAKQRRNKAIRSANALLAESHQVRSDHAALRAQHAAAMAVHGQWRWEQLVHELLLPFKSITPRMIAAAVATCFDNGTMYCMRAQVVSGRLYVTDYRAIFFDRYYAPSRVMPLLETLRWHPNLPDIDIVVAANDEPRIKTMADGRNPKYWARLCDKYPGIARSKVSGQATIDLPPPLFSSTISRHHLDLPWLDFSFFMPRKPHKLRTPPWSKLHPRLVEQGGSVRWEDKVELAMHTGNVGSPFRQALAAAARRYPSTMLVNELFIGDHGKIRKTCEDLGLHRQGGFQQHKCYMTFAQQCSYKYLLQSASIGYANKVRVSLLSLNLAHACCPTPLTCPVFDALCAQVQIPAALWERGDLRAGRHDAQGVLRARAPPRRALRHRTDSGRRARYG